MNLPEGRDKCGLAVGASKELEEKGGVGGGELRRAAGQGTWHLAQGSAAACSAKGSRGCVEVSQGTLSSPIQRLLQPGHMERELLV